MSDRPRSTGVDDRPLGQPSTAQCEHALTDREAFDLVADLDHARDVLAAGRPTVGHAALVATLAHEHVGVGDAGGVDLTWP